MYIQSKSIKNNFEFTNLVNSLKCLGFHDSLVGKESAWNAGDPGLILG